MHESYTERGKSLRKFVKKHLDYEEIGNIP
ncbi:hypothetical protein CLV59_101631 [Chitinophaga dinghuensis]|uniref:Uncharacterized protein n=1 Tax=Chitinophaga dinghuensis TaxID=1539050 RepID=A0A327WET8_9BACT|nr:hypothetical protein CLV59_101631 [Chitinophaga dinghuensis]